MIKKLFLVSILLSGGWMAGIAHAQETAPQETNNKNWFVSAAGGVQVYFSDHDRQAQFGVGTGFGYCCRKMV